MKEIGRNEELIKILLADLTIWDGIMEKIEISSDRSDHRPNISLDIKSVNSKKFSKLRLIFNHVMAFEFNYSKEYIFYNIEEVVFFITVDGNVYISLDPYDSRSIDKKISELDGDFILSQEVIGYSFDEV